MKAIILLALLPILFCSPAVAQTPQPVLTAVPPTRLAHLRHGINIYGWFGQVYGSEGYTREHFEKHETAEDIALINSMGFDHVRLVINPQPMFRNNQADRIPAEYLSELDRGVKMILDQGLAVVIDMHPESDFKHNLATRPDFVEEFEDFWRALARHYSNLNPDYVFFEILNEPEFHDRYAWYGVEAKLAMAIREGAPQNTIIATGASYSADDELVFLEPLHDPNVIYNFHFYEPHTFTHQGATWGVNFWHYVHGLTYPSNLENAEKAAALVPDAVNRLQVLRYGMDHWDAQRIGMEIGQAAAWGKRWNVPLVCNEFGAFRPYMDPKDRAAWLRDVRTALERDGIGWAMWEYDSTFGVVTMENGKKVPDQLTLTALGLR
jgi:endoglucanase